MSSKSPLRLVLALLTGIALLFLLLLGILLTDTLVNIWHNLREAPAWLQLVVVTLLLLFSLFSGWLVWRVMRPKRPLREVDELAPVDRETLNRHLDTAREKGLDTSSAEQELQKLERRREAGSIPVSYTHLTLPTKA